VGVIPDGIHVHPATLRLISGLQLIFITDRVSPAGNGGTVGTLGGPPAALRVIAGAARLADGTLAGSLITMLDGARLMLEELGGDWAGVCAVCAENPARLLGLHRRGRLAPRQRADLMLVDQRLNLKAVYIGGREID
jgi:N-acetylglucosamine-6-phosphate deacetylase